MSFKGFKDGGRRISSPLKMITPSILKILYIVQEGRAGFSGASSI